MIFSDYSSFLEIAFGVNLLFGVWDGIYIQLEKIGNLAIARHTEVLKSAKIDQEQLHQLDENRNSIRNFLRYLGRVVGIVSAIVIAVSFLLVNGNAEILCRHLVSIVTAGFLLPSIMLVMVISDLLCNYRMKRHTERLVYKAHQTKETASDALTNAPD